MREALEKRAGKIAFRTGEARSVVLRWRSLRRTLRDGDDSVSVAEERVLRLQTAVTACLRESVCLVTAARLCYIDSFAFRGVAQPGRALGSGPRGRKFESCHPDSSEVQPESRLRFPAGVRQ
jgi:hypothetical protein